MRKIIAILLSMVVSLSFAFDKDLETIVRPEQPVGNWCMFVLDVSGSMQNWKKAEKLVELFKAVSENPSDEYYIAITAFGKDAHRWEGYKPKDSTATLTKGWAAMPDPNAITAAEKWLRGIDDCNDTRPERGIEEALKDPKPGMHTVFVSDGIYEQAKAITATRMAQRRRIQAGYEKSYMTTILVQGPECERYYKDADQFMKWAGTRYEGGFHRVKISKAKNLNKEDDEDSDPINILPNNSQFGPGGLIGPK